jgi:hypothetical protein
VRKRGERGEGDMREKVKILSIKKEGKTSRLTKTEKKKERNREMDRKRKERCFCCS